MDSKSPGFEKSYGLIPNFLYKERSSKITTFKMLKRDKIHLVIVDFDTGLCGGEN